MAGKQDGDTAQPNVLSPPNTLLSPPLFRSPFSSFHHLKPSLFRIIHTSTVLVLSSLTLSTNRPANLKTSLMGKSRQESMSKADRKFEKKVQFYTKVRDTVKVLTAQKSITKKKKLRSRQKKLKAYDLSNLSEFLPELKGPQQPTKEADRKVNCKSRQKLMLKEGQRLAIVVNHPAFQSDPLGAIHQHLQSTQPVADEKPKKKTSKGGGKKSKGKKSKASTTPQAMEL